MNPIDLSLNLVSSDWLLQTCVSRIRATTEPHALALSHLSELTLAESVAQIVARNLKSGRAQRVTTIQRNTTSADNQVGLETYIDRVITTYLKEHRRIARLADRDNAEWALLFEQLSNRAYNMLLRWRVPSDLATDRSIDFAQDTCEIIFVHPYPFDVNFDAWATLILKNRILGQYTRSRDLLDQAALMYSLDQQDPDGDNNSFSWHDLLADETTPAFERAEIQELLLQAIDRLPSRSQQQVIIYIYFDELNEAEIAQRLHKSEQAIYNLKHRALGHLRQILRNERFGSADALDNLVNRSKNERD
jgi:RNA polymerase sigma factor (sigma-70 family)